jgi:O-succinylbenzoate synthase
MSPEAAKMTYTCPSCGNLEFDPSRQCTCGYQADEQFFKKSIMHRFKEINSKEEQEKKPKRPAPGSSRQADHEVLREIDAWQATYTEGEDCIRLGTPALQSFRLALTVDILEELLEYLYQKQEINRTIRASSLSQENLSEVVRHISALVDEKRAKVKVTLDSKELNAIGTIIQGLLNT